MAADEHLNKNGHPEHSEGSHQVEGDSSGSMSLQNDSVKKARDDFPILKTQMNGKPLAFLDSAASAQKPQIVIDSMNAVYETGYSNIHRGLYKISQKLTEECEVVRSKVAAFLNAPSERNIVFTRNTTEAINLVAQSWGAVNLQKGDEIIISEMEHHANIVPWQMLRDQIGIVLKIIPVDGEGVLELSKLEGLLNGNTKLCALTHVSNALGTINPIKEIINKTKNFNDNIKVLIDGSQSVVHGKVDVQDLDVDFYCFTGHKLYGPSGIGVLYGKLDLLEDMPPYQGGGDMIERVTFEKTNYREAPFKFEAGTPAITEIIGLGAAIDYVSALGMENIAAHESALLGYATEQMQGLNDIQFYGIAPKKVGVISFTVDHAHASDVGMVLDQCGVAVRCGHHCCMPLMQRYNIDGTVRASIGLYTNKDDIDAMIGGLHKVQELFG